MNEKWGCCQARTKYPLPTWRATNFNSSKVNVDEMSDEGKFKLRAISSASIGVALKIAKSVSSFSVRSFRFCKGVDGATRFKVSKISPIFVSGIAPSLRSILGPSDTGEVIGPGTAKTSRFSESAERAVISEPDAIADSTMIVALDMPAMSRLRTG